MTTPETKTGLRTDGLSAVLLDAGGTLITLDYGWFARELSRRGVRAGERELLAAEAEARSWADARVRAGQAPLELWRGYFGRMLGGAGLDGEDRELFIDELWRRNREEGLWRTPVPCAARVLEELKARGYRLAVVSNAEGQVEADLRAVGLARWLEFVVDSHVVGVAKPDPRIFEIALDRLELPAHEVLYVGDVYALDVVGARAAGLRACLLDPTGAYPEADVPRLASVEDLLRLLPPLGSPGDRAPRA